MVRIPVRTVVLVLVVPVRMMRDALVVCGWFPDDAVLAAPRAALP